jgi:hypothetical protein
MTWGGLNPALTSWRGGIKELFPHRSDASDGGYADSNHGSKSEHQADADGSVDAYDMDNNLLGSGEPHGDSRERKLLEALKKDFEADPRAHLWISHGEIAQHDDRNWYRDDYTGSSNPHDEHTHWQSHEQNERDGSPWVFTHTIDLLVEMGLMDVKVTAFSPAALEDLRDAAGVGWHNQEIGGTGVTASVSADRTNDAVTGGTGSGTALWARLDKQDAAIARIEALLTAAPPPPV